MIRRIKDRLLRVRLQKDEKEIKTLFLLEGLMAAVLCIGFLYLYFFIVRNENTPRVIIQSSTISIPSPTVTPTSIPLPAASNEAGIFSPPQTSIAKEYFIPFGSGTNQTDDWADVPGVQATIDFGQYPNIKEARFEASVYVPTANEFVLVRLFNVTDKHPVWYSEVKMNGNASAYLTSQPLIYDKGPKLYQVQMKTQLKAVANLVQSRIHIILK